MRVLVDTCVIIDALQSRAPFSEAAQKLFIYSANKQFEGYITAKSVTDIYYLTHRLTHNDVETRKILSKLFTLFHLLDTTLCIVHTSWWYTSYDIYFWSSRYYIIF